MNNAKKTAFSVIMPAYNRAHTIMRAVNSVLQQTFSNFELVIVDDGSTDETVNVIRSVDDERIRLIESVGNAGAAAARNRAIKEARGEFICFLDSDDCFEYDYLQQAFDALNDSADTIGFVWCGTRFHETDTSGNEIIKEIVWNPKISGNAYHTFLRNLHIGIGCGVSFKREVFNTVGLFKTELPAAEDTDFFLRVSQHYSFKVINQILVNIYKSGGDRVSLKFDKLSRAYELFIADHMKAIDADKQLRLKYYYKLCWLAYHDNDKVKARKYFRKILADAPFHPKAWMVGILFEILGEKKGARLHQKLSKAV